MGRGVWRRLRVFVAMLWVLLIPSLARAAAPIALGRAASAVIGESLEVFRDPSGAMQLSDVRSATFSAAPRHPSFGFTRDTIWLRFTLANTSAVAATYMIEVGREWIDEADLFAPDGSVVRTGALVPLARRPVPSERLVVPVTLPANATHTYYLRVRGNASMAIDGTIETLERFAENDARAHLGFGVFYGALLAIAVANLLLFSVLRERLQLVLSIMLLGYLLGEACSHGHASRVLPAFAGWFEVSGAALAFGVFSAALLSFGRGTLSTAVHLPRLDRGIRIASVAISLCCLSGVISPRFGYVVWGGLLLSPPFIVVPGVIRLRQRDRTAVWFLLAISALIFPVSVTLLIIYGLIPLIPSIDQWNHAGAVAMSCLFSLGIADRIRIARDDLEQRNREVNTLNEELRLQVVARSRELADALARLDVRVSAPTLTDGDVFQERYRVRQLLGRGGMGAVYEIERISDGRSLALKLMTDAVSGADAARFAREAHIGAKIRHRNIVSIVDVGLSESNSPFLIMELVRGGSLEDARSKFGDVDWAIAILTGVASGLSELHRAGVVHRDLKPANVLLDAVGGSALPKIADFGIARVIEAPADAGAPTVIARRDALSVTGTGAILGTPLYMPPEAMTGGGASRAADIFSFGVMAYEALSGDRPFATPLAVLAMAGVPLATPAPLASSVPRAIAEVVMRCLAHTAGERPTIDEIVEVFAHAHDGARGSTGASRAGLAGTQ